MTQRTNSEETTTASDQVNAEPNWSPPSDWSRIPSEFWLHNWALVVVRPPCTNPYRTLALPPLAPPASSPGTPIARSHRGPLPNSPAPRANPNSSPAFEPPGTPGEFCDHSWLRPDRNPVRSP